MKIGDVVIVGNTLLYNGRIGILSEAYDDFWDYNVQLFDDVSDSVSGRIIGVYSDQVRGIS